ncbi:MAG: GNAT family N-acetyltransferase [Rikenellaceae bacterium]
MTNIKGDRVVLRAVEPSDVNWLYSWENDVDVWPVSGTLSPFSHHTLSQFIEAQREDIYSSRQLRLMISTLDESSVVGVVDLFEFDPHNLRAGVGIMIAPAFRRLGYAADALLSLERYASNFLRVHQLWCNVEEDNKASLALFTSLGYVSIGVKRDWNISPEGYKSEVIFQKIIE